MDKKDVVSTAAAIIIRVDQYIEQSDRKAKIMLMGISRAFSKNNGALLWKTLYKKGLPEETTKHKERTPRNKTGARK